MRFDRATGRRIERRRRDDATADGSGHDAAARPACRRGSPTTSAGCGGSCSRRPSSTSCCSSAFRSCCRSTTASSDVTVGSRELHFVGLENFHRVIDSRDVLDRRSRTPFIFTIVSQILRARPRQHPGHGADRRFPRQVARAAPDPAALGRADLARHRSAGCGSSIPSTASSTGPARRVGILGPDHWPIWLGQPNLAMASVIMVHMSGASLPLATVIILAGLTSIPQDIHDAAAVDGAGFWRHLFQITLPLVAADHAGGACCSASSSPSPT